MDSDASDAALSENDEPQQKRHFRFADLLTEVPDGDTAAATELLLTERGLTSMDSLEALRSLKKLELRGNHLASLAFLEMNHELCWLGLAKNRLRRLSHLDNLSSLAVLDISDNRIARLDGLASLSGLKALIATRNRISQIQGLSPGKNPVLETLVLSNNSIAECRIAKFACLRKLSVAHNELHAFPVLKSLPALAELRLNGNRVSSVAKDLHFLPKLSILDIGNNLYSTAEQMEPLRGLRLKNLNVLGNPATSDMESPALKELFCSLKSLEILNNRRLAGGSQKKRRQPGAAKVWPPPGAAAAGEAPARPSGRRRAAARPEPPGGGGGGALTVNGQAFQGRREVFDDDDEDEAATAPATRAAGVQGSESSAKKGKGKKKGGKRLVKEGRESRSQPAGDPGKVPEAGCQSGAPEGSRHNSRGAGQLKPKAIGKRREAQCSVDNLDQKTRTCKAKKKRRRASAGV
mmetsp:Transcript_74531/g.230335  ORF Transcript_74531/g.230335 Transcript_74531/m.230335 type:complete len:464 (+) Transcript_74531:32-1423(+)